MTTQELALNIAVNLGRIGRWSLEGKMNRLNQFLDETQEYIRQLEQTPKSVRFQRTFDVFRVSFDDLKNGARPDQAWAEMMFTWANILTHRANL